ncbi:MAG: hypothetical protein R3E87_19780 [Burkholderiaceae bacterium]
MHEVLAYVVRVTTLCALIGVASGCGGGGSSAQLGDPAVSPDSSSNAGTKETVVSGLVAKGTIAGGSVVATLLVDGQPDGESRTATVASNGAYSISMPRGLILLQLDVNGGASTNDEATGASIPLPRAFTLRSLVDTTHAQDDQPVRAHITAYSELIAVLAGRSGPLDSSNVAVARAAVSYWLGVDPISTTPVQLSELDLGTSSVAEQRLSVMNAALSNIAASDAFQCATGTDYGQQIACTVSRLAEQVEITTTPVAASNNLKALSLPATLATTQAAAEYLSRGMREAVSAVAQRTIDAAQATAALISNVGSTVWDSVRISMSDAEMERVAKAALDGDIRAQEVAFESHAYLHMSDLVYGQVAPEHSNSSPFENRFDSQGNPLPTGWRIVDWRYFLNGAAASFSGPEKGGLYYNVFVNQDRRELVFAYRGTELFPEFALDMAMNSYQNFFCGTLTPAYQNALWGLDAFVQELPGTPYRGYRIVTTGHSLGGGIASFVKLKRPDVVDEAVGFNSAPLCALGGIWEQLKPNGVAPIDIPDVRHVVIVAEAVTLVSITGAYRPGIIDWFPRPVGMAGPTLGFVDAHGTSALKVVIDYARARRCERQPCGVTTTPAPAPPAVPYEARLAASSFTADSVPYTGKLTVKGMGLASTSKIRFACRDPRGVTCDGSPYTWTPNDWGKKVEIVDDSTIILRPTLLGSSDAGAYGTYDWTVTAVSRDGKAIESRFTVTYQPSGTGAISVATVTSDAFLPGTRIMQASTAPFAPTISFTGQSLDRVIRIEIDASGSGAVDQVWRLGDSAWSAGVGRQDPTRLSISPTLATSADRWPGITVWTVRLFDAQGNRRTATFSVQRMATPPAPTGSISGAEFKRVMVPSTGGHQLLSNLAIMEQFALEIDTERFFSALRAVSGTHPLGDGIGLAPLYAEVAPLEIRFSPAEVASRLIVNGTDFASDGLSDGARITPGSVALTYRSTRGESIQVRLMASATDSAEGVVCWLFDLAQLKRSICIRHNLAGVGTAATVAADTKDNAPTFDWRWRALLARPSSPASLDELRIMGNEELASREMTCTDYDLTRPGQPLKTYTAMVGLTPSSVVVGDDRGYRFIPNAELTRVVGQDVVNETRSILSGIRGQYLEYEYDRFRVRRVLARSGGGGVSSETRCQ